MRWSASKPKSVLGIKNKSATICKLPTMPPPHNSFLLSFALITLITTEMEYFPYVYLTFFLIKKIFFNWRLIALQYCGGFCHTFTWISHGCTCVPILNLPPHPIPQGHPSTPALSTLSHALNLDWWSISRMIIYMFQCCSLKSSHPRLLSQSPKVVLYICVSFAVSHTGLSYHLSKFHVYALIYYIGVFLSDFLHSV